MKTTLVSFKTALLTAATLCVSAGFARASFDWENLEGDIPGVAEITDSNVINPWGITLSPSGTIFVADNGASGAVYKGATVGVANSQNYLYVTNFHSGHVETYNGSFVLQAGFPFTDPNLPAGYAPFGIRNFGGQIFVTYAKINPSNPGDDLAGP